MNLEYSEFNIYNDVKGNVDFIAQDIKEKMRLRQKLAEMALHEHGIQHPSPQDIQERPNLRLVDLNIDDMEATDLLEMSSWIVEQYNFHRKDAKQQLNILQEAQDYLVRIIDSIDLIRDESGESETKTLRGIDNLEQIKKDMGRSNLNE